MKSKNINMFIVEGADGVGKTTLYEKLLKQFNYVFPVYDRGELSNFVYAKKFNRPFASSQRNLPILYILLYCKKDILRNRILERGQKNYWPISLIDSELDKINDQDIFLENIENFSKDYHIITIDNSLLNEDETLSVATQKINEYLEKLNCDSENTYSDWNKLYSTECEKLGLEFKTINNQPYINGFPIMAECNLHNGLYETFTDKRVPHNLIYCQYYNQEPNILNIFDRKEDFAYIINSKIFTRHEVYDYFNSFTENNLSCLTGTTQFCESNPLIKCCDRVFGDEYIKLISNAKATVYIGRRLEYLKYLSTRLYESIIAKQIIFVDELSDKDNDILRNIHGENNEILNILRVTPKNICEKYNELMKNSNLVEIIIKNQSEWYEKLKESVLKDIEMNGILGVKK